MLYNYIKVKNFNVRIRPFFANPVTYTSSLVILIIKNTVFVDLRINKQSSLITVDSVAFVIMRFTTRPNPKHLMLYVEN